MIYSAQLIVNATRQVQPNRRTENGIIGREASSDKPSRPSRLTGTLYRNGDRRRMDFVTRKLMLISTCQGQEPLSQAHHPTHSSFRPQST